MYYETLEREFALWCGTKYAVTVNSGTAALHLALVAAGVGPGDEVIVPEFTMAATAFAVSYTGAKPVFVDCNYEDYNINTDLIEGALTDRTKAIMPVHVYGRSCDMDRINAIAKKHNLWVIEDAAEAHGAFTSNGMVGSLGHLGCFSLYQNKIISAQEGGIVTTDDEELYNKMQSLKCMAFTEEHDFMHTAIGFNYRMPEAQAKMALANLYLFDQIIEGRRRGDGGVYWVYDYVYATQEERDAEMAKDKALGKKVRHFFKPMSMQPMYLGEYEHLVAYDLSKRGMYLAID